jgi:hypothetical protein
MKVARFLIVLLVLVSACKTKKNVKNNIEPPLATNAATASKERIINSVLAAKNTSPYLYFTAEAAYKDEKMAQTLNIELQAKENEYVWFNVKVLFVNVARILLQPDSIRILDLLNRRYISASYNYLNNYTSVPMGYMQLQNLFYGNVLFEPTLKATVDTLTNDLLLYLSITGGTQISTHVQPMLKTSSVAVKEQASAARFLKVNYAKPLQDGNNLWPQSIEIHIEAEKKVDCNFSIRNLATAKNREPQFVVPKSYKVVVYP